MHNGDDLYYFANAHLSSASLVMDAIGAAVSSQRYMPFGEVRQIVDANGTVQFYQSYEPYGDVLESIGVGESSYGYAGEWTDASGMQYLRSRYYNTGIGRFLTRDTWPGNHNRPQNLNRWAYVEGNPVNFVDPSGFYRWRSTGSWQHYVIEELLELEYGFWQIHSEYPIQNDSISSSVADIIYNPIAWDRQTSLRPKPLSYNYETPSGMFGFVYDIKPYYGKHSVVEATFQAMDYVLALNAFDYLQEGVPADPFDGYYNWTDMEWFLGEFSLPKKIMFIPINPVGELAVWFAGSGAIMYADSRWVDSDPEKVFRLPRFVLVEWENHSNDNDNNLSKEQKQFIEMVNIKTISIPVETELTIICSSSLWLIMKGAEAAVCGPCAIAFP